MIRKLIVVLGLVLVLAAGYFLFFTEEDSDMKTQTAEAPAPAPAQTGAEAKTQSQPQPASGEFWAERCNKEGEKYCEVFQRLTLAKTNQRLVEFAVGYPKEAKGEAQAAIVLPLGILVSEGVGLMVDGGSPAKATIRTCAAEGCITVMNLPKSFVDVMKKGKIITVAFIDSTSGKQVNVEMSLSGFGEKLSKLKQ